MAKVEKGTRKGMTLNEKIDELYRQFNTTRSLMKKRELYRAIKRAEAKRRKEKLKQEFK